MTSLSRQLSPQAQLLVDELARAWRDGQSLRIEELLQRHPESVDQSDVIIPLIYEELCLREESGEVVQRQEYARRFPRWREQLEMLLDCYELLAFPSRNVRFPDIGETLGDFELIAELGRGAAGRVFLARQTELSDRYVVLKVTPCIGDEHLSLARLQHSSIVPVYLVQEFPEQGLRILCMPYLGGLTLSQLLDSLQDTPPENRSGRDISRLLDRALDAEPIQFGIRGPARQFLSNATYTQAVCWIGACLADALHYAHERGLLHLDVKPSNVLLASDGQPMLLDFHLARESCEIAARRVDWIGGTAGYMAPEQQRLLDSLRDGQTSDLLVDRRSDIYALGVLLNELMSGRLAKEEGDHCVNRATESGIHSIIQRCLQVDPKLRFQNAKDVASELRRCLVEPSRVASLLSKQTPKRSWWRRWLPMIGAAAWLASIFAITTVLARIENVKLAIVRATGLTRQNETAEATQLLYNASESIAWLPGAGNVRAQIDEQLQLTKRVEAALQLHIIVDQLRMLDGPRTLPDAQLRVIAQRCEQVWSRRQQLVDMLGIETNGIATSAAEQQGPRTDLLDLAILWSDLRIRLASGSEANPMRKLSEKTLLAAIRLVGPAPVVYQEIARHLKHAGLQTEAEKYAAISRDVPPQSAWEHYALGRSFLQSKQFAEAECELRLAASLAPDHYWYQFYAGVVSYRLGKFPDAIAAFGACIALEPQRAESYHYRGLAFSENHQPDRAKADFVQAQRLAEPAP
ncbi:MAG: protein kinase [Pirellulaceae bacterium]